MRRAAGSSRATGEIAGPDRGVKGQMAMVGHEPDVAFSAKTPPAMFAR